VQPLTAAAVQRLRPDAACMRLPPRNGGEPRRQSRAPLGVSLDAPRDQPPTEGVDLAYHQQPRDGITWRRTSGDHRGLNGQRVRHGAAPVCDRESIRLASHPSRSHSGATLAQPPKTPEAHAPDSNDATGSAPTASASHAPKSSPYAPLNAVPPGHRPESAGWTPDIPTRVKADSNAVEECSTTLLVSVFVFVGRNNELVVIHLEVMGAIDDRIVWNPHGQRRSTSGKGEL
jgi:hypothetical protein